MFCWSNHLCLHVCFEHMEIVEIGFETHKIHHGLYDSHILIHMIYIYICCILFMNYDVVFEDICYIDK